MRYDDAAVLPSKTLPIFQHQCCPPKGPSSHAGDSIRQESSRLLHGGSTAGSPRRCTDSLPRRGGERERETHKARRKQNGKQHLGLTAQPQQQTNNSQKSRQHPSNTLETTNRLPDCIYMTTSSSRLCSPGQHQKNIQSATFLQVTKPRWLVTTGTAAHSQAASPAPATAKPPTQTVCAASRQPVSAAPATRTASCRHSAAQHAHTGARAAHAWQQTIQRAPLPGGLPVRVAGELRGLLAGT